MNQEPSELGIAKRVRSLLLIVCLLGLAGPGASALAADATVDPAGPTAASAAVGTPDLEVTPAASDPVEIPPCVKVSTNPPSAEVGHCSGDSAPIQDADGPPCVKVSTEPPSAEVGHCSGDSAPVQDADGPPCVKVSTEPPSVEVGRCSGL